jgi:cytochrome b
MNDECSREEFWKELDEIFASITPFLAGLRIAGVLFSSYAHKGNLIEGMPTGRNGGGPEQVLKGEIQESLLSTPRQLQS